MEDRYLGDGVYASFDGYHITLDLRGQVNFMRIALEPEVFYALECFKKDLKAEQQKYELEAFNEPNL